jgi:ketosteroid isomerase-like protein
MNELVELEQKGWQALSMKGDAGKRFYGDILREDAVMLLSNGMRIEGRDHILQSFGAQPWKTFQIENPQVISLTVDAATLVYRVTAQRAGSKPYEALVSSTYVRDREWRLVFHQQTPV